MSDLLKIFQLICLNREINQRNRQLSSLAVEQAIRVSETLAHVLEIWLVIVSWFADQFWEIGGWTGPVQKAQMYSDAYFKGSKCSIVCLYWVENNLFPELNSSTVIQSATKLQAKSRLKIKRKRFRRKKSKKTRCNSKICWRQSPKTQ